MTTIVSDRRTGNQYILLGINSEANKANPSRFISELFNQEKSEVSCSATVCDVQGNIFLAYIDDLLVVEIDGVKPAEILPPEQPRNSSPEKTNDWRSEESYSLRSPSNEFEEDEEDFEEDENAVATPIKPVIVDVVDSLDAPNRELNDDEEDWI